MPNKGFTLIELLVVITIIGVLAAGVIVAVNPGEQLAKGRDAIRQQQMRSLASALSQYAIINNGSYPVESGTWMNNLINTGALKTALINPSGVNAVRTPPDECFSNTEGTNQNGYCYENDGVNVWIQAPTESRVEGAKGGCDMIAWRAWYRFSLTTDTLTYRCHSYPPP